MNTQRLPAFLDASTELVDHSGEEERLQLGTKSLG